MFFLFKFMFIIYRFERFKLILKFLISKKNRNSELKFLYKIKNSEFQKIVKLVKRFKDRINAIIEKKQNHAMITELMLKLL